MEREPFVAHFADELHAGVSVGIEDKAKHAADEVVHLWAVACVGHIAGIAMFDCFFGAAFSHGAPRSFFVFCTSGAFSV